MGLRGTSLLKNNTTSIIIRVSDSILESCSKKKKDLLEEIGIDTDESVGAVMPS